MARPWRRNPGMAPLSAVHFPRVRGPCVFAPDNRISATSAIESLVFPIRGRLEVDRNRMVQGPVFIRPHDLGGLHRWCSGTSMLELSHDCTGYERIDLSLPSRRGNARSVGRAVSRGPGIQEEQFVGGEEAIL